MTIFSINSEQHRHRSLQRQVKNLGKRVELLTRQSIRLSWMRAILFLSILAAVLICTKFVNHLSAWIVLVAGMGIFGAVALIHKRLEFRKKRMALFAELLNEEAARLTHSWSLIPAPPVEHIHQDHAFAMDLDIIGMRSLHHLINLGITQGGSSRLAQWLCSESPQWDELPQRQKAVKEMTCFIPIWRRIMLKLRLKDRTLINTIKLQQWASHEFKLPPMRNNFIIATILVVINVLAFTLSQVLKTPPYWILTTITWTIFYFFKSRAITSHFHILAELDDELTQLKNLFLDIESFPCASNTALGSYFKPFAQDKILPSGLLKRIKLITAAIGLRQNPVLAILLNLALPWDFFFARRAECLEITVHRHFPKWLDALHNIEAIASLAGITWRHTKWTLPDIERKKNQPLMTASDMGHPLLPFNQRRVNNFILEKPGHIDLITGSNMAGKSTFLRTVGINLVLAWAGGPVCASAFSTARFRLFTSMRINDSLTDGVSTFYAEVKRLKSLLDAITAEHPILLYFFVDEIFRGTNNRERLTGSQAFLKSVAGKNCTGLVSTHDLELTSLAKENLHIHNHHFCEEIIDGKLHFDYSLKHGPCPTTNALIIMKQHGLPV
ncbi:hypothetical protein KAR48_00010 [bacterium]|nr:hypothetical protein [bacterium]